MKNIKTNVSATFSRDDRIFLIIIIACLILFCLFISLIIYKKSENKRDEQIEIQLSIVSHELNKSLGNVENFLQFIGDKFVNIKPKEIEAYSKLFQHNYTIDSNFQNIYLSTFINWVNKSGSIIITANDGLLKKPISVPDYYPLEAALAKPWELTISKTQYDKKGYFIPIAISIYDDNDVYVGSIVADIITDSLQRELNLSITNETIEYMVLDSGNNILISSANKNNHPTEINISYANLDSPKEYNKFITPIKYGDIIFTAYKKSSLGFIILTGYSPTKEREIFLSEIKPYLYIASILTLIFLFLSYLFRNAIILPLISKLRNNLRKETEARILNEQMLSRILKNIPGFVYRHRIHKNNVFVEYISEGCTDLTGYKAEQYINKTNPVNHTEVIDPEYLESVLKTVRNIVPYYYRTRPEKMGT
jgi:hypothetical protein